MQNQQSPVRTVQMCVLGIGHNCGHCNMCFTLVHQLGAMLRRWVKLYNKCQYTANYEITSRHQLSTQCLHNKRFFFWDDTIFIFMLIYNHNTRSLPTVDSIGMELSWEQMSRAYHAVADMGNRLATTDMGQRVGCCGLLCPFRGRGLGPHVTQRGLGHEVAP